MNGYTSQEVRPWNVKFARELKETAFSAREALAGKDAPQLARELLAMTQDEVAASFKNSPMKRAQLRGLQHNAAVVLGNVGSLEEVDALTCALNDPEPHVREHAAWALRRLAVRCRRGGGS